MHQIQRTSNLSQIAVQIKEVYKLELPEEQISKITASVIEEVAKWHIRPLASKYLFEILLGNKPFGFYIVSNEASFIIVMRNCH